MKLIVGLGNPGKFYRDSRHNIGFLVVKALAKAYKISFKQDSGALSLVGKGKIGEQNILLAMPITYMNLSGSAVGALLKKYKIDKDNLLIICDDLDLDFGRLKIKSSGSSGGHRGLQSIIESLGGKNFSRLRIGIGRPLLSGTLKVKIKLSERHTDMRDYVLSHFSRGEKKEFLQILEKAADCCRIWATEGVDKCMNIFNQRSEER